MAVTKQQAIEMMKVRGYGQVSEAGSGVWVGFSKDMNGIWISAQVDLIKESVTMSGGILKMLCEINTASFDLHHKRFEDLERTLYFYAKVCSYIDTFTEDERFIRRYTEVALDEYPVKNEGVSEGVNEGVKKPEKKDIKTRKREFWDELTPVAKKRGWTKEQTLKFYNYWTEESKAGKRFRRENETYFDINKRMATFDNFDNQRIVERKNFIEKKADNQNKEIAINKTINTKDFF